MSAAQKALYDAARSGALADMTDADLGACFREYIRESSHGGWEGFNQRDVEAFRRLLIDFQAFATAWQK